MPIATRTFRVFVSSTFEDLKQERDALQREVDPKLRKLCEQHGARFQAIDLRWGVRDEAALDQKTMEICLREIERCQRTGIKPNFIVLLGQRYGWRPLPSRIEAREFEAVRDRIASPEERGLVESSYQRDDNALPPAHLLKPRTGEWVKPESWLALEARLHRILLDAARAAGLSEQALVKYWASATHQEILKGLGATPEDRRHLFAFCRDVPDENCDPDLVSLKSFLRAQLPAENILSYSPTDFPRLCQDVERTLRAVIESEAAGFESRPALALEIEAHDAFARERALVFGREKVLDTITEYVRAGSDRPLVLHGASGSGKSAVMAQASDQARAALPSAVVIRRFIGASPESSSGLTLLHNLSEQIGEAYGAAGELPMDFKGVARVFRERLGLGTSERPLVVFVDALDQLGQDNPARSLNWLAGALPPDRHVVVSTTDLAPALNECRLLKLEALPQADAATALDHWLDGARRRLQPVQRERLLAAFSRCGLPLYLKLAFEEARGWASYLPSEECLLGDGVGGVIDTLLNRLSLEANHGPLLVSRGLSYLAAARYGLTEDEMLDVLSADEEVWQDFERRAHHNPPERRLPVIVWSRLFLDLEPYLSERSTPGGTVASFYHRQLAEQAAARFLNGEQSHQRHASLAEYFDAQPHWFDRPGGSPNLRKAVELPFQLMCGQMWHQLALILCDLSFIEAKCQAGLVRELIDDHTAALASGQMSTALRQSLEAYADFVRSEAHVVAARPHLLLPKAFNAASSGVVSEAANKLIHDPSHTVRAWFRLVNRPSRPAHPCRLTLSGHAGAVRTHAITRDGQRIVSVGEDDTLRVWDLKTGECLRVVHMSVKNVTELALTPDGLRAVVKGENNGLHVCDLEGGVLWRTLPPAPKGGAFLSISTDARFLIVASSKIQIRDFASGETIREFDEFASPCHITCFAASANGQTAISGHIDGAVRAWNLQTGEYRLLQSERSGRSANAVDVSADGHIAVSLSSDQVRYRWKTVKLWDVGTGDLLNSMLITSSEEAEAIALTPDARSVVIAGGGKLIVWDRESGAALGELSTGRVSSVSVTPDGATAVCSGYDDSIRVWSLPSRTPVGKKTAVRECRGVLAGHRGSVNVLAVSGDGGQILTGSRDGTARIWDLGSGRCETVLKCCGPVSAAVWKPDGRFILTASDTTIQVWESGKLVRSLSGHPAPICDLAIKVSETSVHALCQNGVVVSWNTIAPGWPLESSSPSQQPPPRLMAFAPGGAPGGDGLVALTACGRIDIYHVRNGELLNAICFPRAIPTALIATHTDTVVIGYADGDVEVWDWMLGMKLQSFKCVDSSVTALAIGKEHHLIVVAHASGVVCVLNLCSGQCEFRLKEGPSAVSSVAISPSSGLIVTGSEDGCARVYDIASVDTREQDRHHDFVTGSEIVPDGRRGITASEDKTVKVWSLATGACERTLVGHASGITHLALTPDSCFGVTGSWDDTARLWSLDTGRCVQVFWGHRILFRWGRLLGVRAIALTPDGRKLLGVLQWGVVKAWSLATGRLRWVRDVLQSSEQRGGGDVVISADGRYVACTDSRDDFVRIRRTSTGHLVASLPAARKAYHMVFAVDARSLLATSREGRVEIWELRTNTLTATLGGGTEQIDNFALTPDGRAVLAITDHGVAVWDLQPPRCRLIIPFGAKCRDVRCSPDGRLAFISLQSNELVVYDLETGHEIVCFSADSSISSFAIDASGKRILAGNSDGRVCVLELENVERAPTVVTAWRSPLWQFWLTPWKVAFGCVVCRKWSCAPVKALGNEHRCPYCATLLRLNPFTLRGNWGRIARSWKG